MTDNASTISPLPTKEELEAVDDIDTVHTMLAALACHESRVDDELEDLLQQQGELEAKLDSLQRIKPRLSSLLSQAHSVASTVGWTCQLAESVSSKVRELDLAQANVQCTISKVNDIVELRECLNGVGKALKERDYDRAALFIYRYSRFTPSVLEFVSADARSNGIGKDPVEQLQQATTVLRGLVTEHFELAIDTGNTVGIQRFFKLFPLIGLANEGLSRYGRYLRSSVGTDAEELFALFLRGQAPGQLNYVGLLTKLFESIANVVEISQPLVETAYGPGAMLPLLAGLQHECDTRASKIFSQFSHQRRLPSLVAEVSVVGGKSGSGTLVLDSVLSEIAALSNRCQLFNRFLRRKILVDLDFLSSDNGDVTASVEIVKAVTSLMELTVLDRRVQELMSLYVVLEDSFLRQSVAKATTLDAVTPGELTSSVVDDVFFIIRKSLRRALASGDTNSVCAMLNNAASMLLTEVKAIFASKLSAPPSGSTGFTSTLGVGGDRDTAKSALAAFIVTLNNVDVCSHFVSKLRRDLAAECETALLLSSHQRDALDSTEEGNGINDEGLKKDLPQGTPAPSDSSELSVSVTKTATTLRNSDDPVRRHAKVESCLIDFNEVSVSYRRLLQTGMESLASNVLSSRINTLLEAFSLVDYRLTEAQFANFEANDPFVGQLISDLDTLLSPLRESLTENNYNALIANHVVTAVAGRLEELIMRARFSQLGGLQLDKDLRLLSVYLADLTSLPVRDKLARLTQTTLLLNFDKVTELHDYWGSNAGPLTWRLTPFEVRRTLALRIDFNSDDINRLKL